MKQTIRTKSDFLCDNCKNKHICKGVETYRLITVLCEEAAQKSDCDFITAEPSCNRYEEQSNTVWKREVKIGRSKTNDS